MNTQPVYESQVTTTAQEKWTIPNWWQPNSYSHRNKKCLGNSQEIRSNFMEEKRLGCSSFSAREFNSRYLADPSQAEEILNLACLWDLTLWESKPEIILRGCYGQVVLNFHLKEPQTFLHGEPCTQGPHNISRASMWSPLILVFIPAYIWGSQQSNPCHLQQTSLCPGNYSETQCGEESEKLLWQWQRQLLPIFYLSKSPLFLFPLWLLVLACHTIKSNHKAPRKT